MKEKYLSFSEAVKFMGCAPSTLKHWRATGEVKTTETKRGSVTVSLHRESDLIRLKKSYKPGRRKDTGVKMQRLGYTYVYQPSHPRADVGGHVAEHVLVMERHIGRHLTDKEQVHHINRKRSDNRIENLFLFSDKGAHMKEAHGGEFANVTTAIRLFCMKGPAFAKRLKEFLDKET